MGDVGDSGDGGGGVAGADADGGHEGGVSRRWRALATAAADEDSEARVSRYRAKARRSFCSE
jgi:hypothetical protein